jgi:hypothetical protein
MHAFAAAFGAVDRSLLRKTECQNAGDWPKGFRSGAVGIAPRARTPAAAWQEGGCLDRDGERAYARCQAEVGKVEAGFEGVEQ